jgi:hypothetical protein
MTSRAWRSRHEGLVIWRHATCLDVGRSRSSATHIVVTVSKGSVTRHVSEGTVWTRIRCKWIMKAHVQSLHAIFRDVIMSRSSAHRMSTTRVMSHFTGYNNTNQMRRV